MKVLRKNGEIAELKFDCECRKPKPGMLLKAAEDFNIDLTQSWMIGDSESDVMAGEAAGCKTAFIGADSEKMCYNDLLEFVTDILENK